MKNIFNRTFQITGILMLSIAMLTSCNQNKKSEDNNNLKKNNMTTYSKDVAFMQKYIEVIELSDPSNNSKVAISAALQGRVMTSSSLGADGRSYGWINKELFESEEIQEHINVYGGEERFWLGPEGGQYSIYFKKGDEFTLDNWYAPRLIDLEAFDVKEQSASKVVFTKEASLKNYSGFQFDMGIERVVSILSKEELQKELGVVLANDNIKTVAYKTVNTITNIGSVDWEKETGLLSIWMLGMYNPSPKTTIFIPYNSGDDSELGIPVNDMYFGKVPSERLSLKNNVIYFSGDGEFRSKIGLPPLRSKDVAGSYDSENGILTIVKYNKPEGVTDYVNSMWEIQDEPFAGDVINAYNDGEPSLGEKPLGPFYELETSSPALDLNAGESGTHIQLTCHIEGDEVALLPIIKKVFGISIDDIKNAF